MATTTKQNTQYCTTAPSIDANIGPWTSIEAYLAWLSSELGVDAPQEGTEILVKDSTGAMTKYRYEIISGDPSWVLSSPKIDIDSSLNTTSTNPVQNKAVAQAVADMQDAANAAIRSAESSAASASSASDSASSAASLATLASHSADRSATQASQAAASATSANNSASLAAQSLTIIQQALEGINPSQSASDAVIAEAATRAAADAAIQADLSILDSKTASLDEALRERIESWNTLADTDDLTGSLFYVLSGDSVYSLDGTSINAVGLMFSCQKGDVFRIYTNGGSGDARAWGVVNSSTTILSKQSGSINALTNPIILEITDDNAAKLYVNMYGTNRDNFKVEKQVVEYGEIKPVAHQSDIETLAERDDSQDISINNIEGELVAEKYEYENVADENDLYSDKWYSLTGSSVSQSTNMSYGYRGYRILVNQGDIYKLSTYGGTTSGSARSWAIATSSGLILARAASSDRDLVTEPALIRITQETAAYLYVNCLGSYRASFYIKSVSISSVRRFDLIEEKLSQVEKLVYNNANAKSILLIGASFAYKENTWFEQACSLLDFVPINEAVSGSKIHADAVRMINGTLFTDINSFDIFAIMHVHNYNVASLSSTYKDYSAAEYEADTNFVDAMNNGAATSAWYAAAFDYVIKKYQTLCYAEKDNTDSPWYGTKSGKPCVIIMCTSWHDARQTYNNAAKTLAEKWGMHLCNFADNIGFSCQRLNAATGAQPSIIYANETTTETFSIDGVSGTHTVGWHPLRGRNQYIQQKMAKIFADCVRSHLW